MRQGLWSLLQCRFLRLPGCSYANCTPDHCTTSSQRGSLGSALMYVFLSLPVPFLSLNSGFEQISTVAKVARMVGLTGSHGVPASAHAIKGGDPDAAFTIIEHRKSLKASTHISSTGTGHVGLLRHATFLAALVRFVCIELKDSLIERLRGAYPKAIRST